MSSGPVELNIHPFPTASLTANVAAQAGAQSILEAAAHASNVTRSSPEWCASYPAAVPSVVPPEYHQMPASGPSGTATSFTFYQLLMALLHGFAEIHQQCSMPVQLFDDLVLLQTIQPGEPCLPILVLLEALSQLCPMSSGVSHSSSPRFADQQHTGHQ